jgi:uncharacterized lipoprotein
MMKRVLATLIAAVFVFSLAACSTVTPDEAQPGKGIVVQGILPTPKS